MHFPALRVLANTGLVGGLPDWLEELIVHDRSLALVVVVEIVIELGPASFAEHELALLAHHAGAHVPATTWFIGRVLLAAFCRLAGDFFVARLGGGQVGWARWIGNRGGTGGRRNVCRRGGSWAFGCIASRWGQAGCFRRTSYDSSACRGSVGGIDGVVGGDGRTSGNRRRRHCAECASVFDRGFEGVFKTRQLSVGNGREDIRGLSSVCWYKKL